MGGSSGWVKKNCIYKCKNAVNWKIQNFAKAAQLHDKKNKLRFSLKIMLFPSTSILASSQHLTQKKSSVATSESTVQRTGKSYFGKAEFR